MALVTTFVTTPLTSALYPHWYQQKLEAWKRGEIDWDGNRLTPEDSSDTDAMSLEKMQSSDVTRLLTYLRLDNMPGVLTFVSLLAKVNSSTTDTKIHHTKLSDVLPDADSSATSSYRPLQVHGVRLMELTDRDSSVMKVSEEDDYTMRDPIVNTFRTFGQLNNVAVAGAVIVSPEASFAATLTEKATEISADLVLIPWSESGAMSENQSLLSDSGDNRYANSPYSNFVTTALRYASCNTAVFVDRGFGRRTRNQPRLLARTVSGMSAREMRRTPALPVMDQGHHIFFPYFGSEDDKAALRFVLQLAQNPTVTATIVHFDLPGMGTEEITRSETQDSPPSVENLKSPVSVKNSTAPPGHYLAFFSSLRDSLPPALSSRVVFESSSTSSPLDDAIEKAKNEVGLNPKNAGDLIVLGCNTGLGGALANSVPQTPSPSVLGSEARRVMGGIAEGVIRNGLSASLLIIKAAGNTNRG